MDRQWGSGGSEDDEDDCQSCLERMEKQPVGGINPRLLVDALQEVICSPEDIPRFLVVLQNVANQFDPFLRSEVIEQIPKLAVVCDGEESHVQGITEKRLLPLLLRALTDTDNQVRKMAQTSLLVLVEQDMLSQQTLEHDVCGVVVDLADYALTNGISLMGKLATLLGKEATIRLFLDKFLECCCDEEHVAVREACARNFGGMCVVLGAETCKTRMVPFFCQLCEDENWTVRKACAEVFMIVSCSLPLETRKTELTTRLLRLLSDEDYMVRLMAYQVLGAFISTLADPPITAIAYDPYGELVFVGPEGFEFRVVSHQPIPQRGLGFGSPRSSDWSSSDMIAGDVVSPTLGEENEHEEDVDQVYNTFRFWQLPVLDLEDILAEDEIQANITSLGNELSSLSEKLDKCSSKDLGDGNDSVISDASTPDSGWNSGANTPHQAQSPLIPRMPSSLSSSSCFVKPIPTQVISNKSQQTIVPQPLLERFLQMAQPSVSGETDKELALHCAYFLPAVVYTLGRDNWPWVVDLFRSLALDRQWKVRRSVASSLYDLASLLGEEVTNRDIAPVLKALLKDLDEVRIGALRHLALTLGLLRPAVRESFLPLLKDFLRIIPMPSSDGDRNWRFREEVAAQLVLACPLFSASDCLKYLAPPTFALLGDKIAAVRRKALALMTQLIQQLSAEPVFRVALLDFIYEEFSEHMLWSRRAVFAQLCSEIASQNALDCELFASSLLPYLLRLAKDVVPNVRLCVARCLSHHLLSSGYIENGSMYFEEASSVLEMLKQDRDCDVREAAAYGNPTHSSATEITFTASATSSPSSQLSSPLT